MSNETLGRFISHARKQKGLSQKQLAERIKIETEDGSTRSISPQYLNDIEHDRRSPSSAQLVEQFSKVLELNVEYLSFLADRWPESLRKGIRSENDFRELAVAFRQKSAS